MFRWFTLNPSFSVRHSLFYGYMDTVPDLDYIRHDTLLHPIDTTLDTYDYAVIDTIPQQVDTLSNGQLDTVSWLVRWQRLEDDSVYKYDTTWNKWADDASWRTGVSLSTKLYGLFPLKILNFAGMRHTFTPTISYNFVPRHDQDKQFFPIGIPYDRGRKRSQTVGISIGNLLQGKVIKPTSDAAKQPQEKKFTIVNSSLSLAYDFEAPQKKWSDLSLSAGTVVKFLRVSYNSSFWMYSRGDEGGKLTFPTLKSYSVSLSPSNVAIGGRFWDGDLLVLRKVQPHDPVEYRNAGHQQWSLSLSPRYSYSGSRRTPDDVFVPNRRYSLDASASLSFTRHWSVTWQSHFDFVQNRFESHALDFHCDLECWDLVFNWTPAGVRPGYFYFKVFLKKIPDIKWEERD
jgi:hypothetical protein